MKKRTIILALAACLCLPFTGCGNTSGNTTATTETEEYFADEDFIADLQKSLVARWTITEASDGILSADDYKEEINSGVQAELDIIEKYQNEKFENTKLQETLLKYINNLKAQIETVAYYGVDDIKYAQEWEALYGERTQIIDDFVKNYGLTVPEEYQSVLNEMLTNAKIVTEKENEEEVINAWIDSIVFEQTEDNYGMKTYQAVVENTTGCNFQYINLHINMIDANGVVLQTAYSSFQNISAGAKVKFEFMSDADFISTETTADYLLQ